MVVGGVGSMWFVIASTGCVVAAILTLLLMFMSLSLSEKGRDLPKGSYGWPLLGETLAFLKPHPSTSLGSFLHLHCSRYGKVFRSDLFFSRTVVSCDEELNYLILQNEGKLFECSYPKPIHGILGSLSMLVAVGDTHKRLRSVAVSLVATTKSKPHFLNDIESEVLAILRSWEGHGRVIFCEQARKFTFNVIVKQVLGLGAEEEESEKILEDFLTFMRGLVSLPLYIPGTPYARAVEARRRICASVKAIIEERRREKKKREEQGSDSGKKRSDFLETLLEVDTLSEDEKVSFVLDALLGGYETTSLLMAMVVHFLALSPPALRQLKAEHVHITSAKNKRKDHRHLNWDDYKNMTFTHNVINEALRLGNIVKFVHRKALTDVRFRDYLIPSGWKVLPVLSAVHLDPSLHPDPLKFNPSRWEGQDQSQTCKKFTPFGGGSRCCPGSDLAKVEVAFFLHHLVQKFRWRIEDEEEQPMAYPYVEFPRGLVLKLDQLTNYN